MNEKANFQVGENEVPLEVIGAGVRNGVLPAPPFQRPLDPIQSRDLAAFREDGWEFDEELTRNWSETPARGPAANVETGLLAVHPSGRLTIVKDKIVIGLRPGAEANWLLDRYVDVDQLPFGSDLFEARIPPRNGNLLSIIKGELDALNSPAAKLESAAAARVAVAEPALAYNLKAIVRMTPADPENQWQWPQIELTQAWDGQYFGAGAYVGVIDCGFHIADDQLKPRIKWMARKKKGVFVVTDKMPGDIHGTFCAGLVAAELDGQGVNGAAPECNLILVGLKANGTADQSDVGKAINICANGLDGNPPARVISCSVGINDSWERSQALKAAIDDAVAKDILIVWADFNVTKEILPNTLEDYRPLFLVAQSDMNDHAVTSGFGPSVDLMAPGDTVAGLDWTSGQSAVGRDSGCSYAAPIVAGVAAIIRAIRPRLTAQEVANILVNKALRPTGSGPNNHDVPRLDAYAAVTEALTRPV